MPSASAPGASPFPLLALALILVLQLQWHQAWGGTFSIENDTFVVDGAPLQIKSGSIHYSRVPRAYWHDRLARLKALGLNTVQTYVMWNFHEAEQGVFNFDGDRDLSTFLQIAQQLDLHVLLRLGPYSCGEWEFGGFPAWILAQQDPPVVLRTNDTYYLSWVDTWWAHLLPVVKPHLHTNGGSVLMVQVENEFGSYGDVESNPGDLEYMHHLVDLVRQHLGDEDSVQIYTTDGGSTSFLSKGTLQGSIVYSTGDHGPGSDQGNCDAMRHFNAPGKSPCMDSEFYTGWLTHWGDTALANTSTAPIVQWLNDMLTRNGSFNIYMGHGGTSFGWWSGANGQGKSYQPDITSYGYDAPVAQGGEHGFGPQGQDKFLAIRDLLVKKHGSKNVPEPALPHREHYPTLHFSHSASLLEQLAVLQPDQKKYPVTTRGANPPSMEQVGQNYGFLVYETTVDAGGKTIGFSTFPRDRVHVFMGHSNELVVPAPIYRPEYNSSVPLSAEAAAGGVLRLLMENCGRLNYGRGMYDPKGIAPGESLLWNGEPMNETTEWKTWSLPLQEEQLARLQWEPIVQESPTFSPTFYLGTLAIPKRSGPSDTYIKPVGWGKGMIWVNGHNLGRFWESKGPQHALFVPAPFLVAGDNEIVLLELDAPNPDLLLRFDDTN